jgi:hypothetical protein
MFFQNVDLRKRAEEVKKFKISPVFSYTFLCFGPANVWVEEGGKRTAKPKAFVQNHNRIHTCDSDMLELKQRITSAVNVQRSLQ